MVGILVDGTESATKEGEVGGEPCGRDPEEESDDDVDEGLGDFVRGGEGKDGEKDCVGNRRGGNENELRTVVEGVD